MSEPAAGLQIGKSAEPVKPSDTFLTDDLNGYGYGYADLNAPEALQEPFYHELDMPDDDEEFERKLKEREQKFYSTLDPMLELNLASLQGKLVAKFCFQDNDHGASHLETTVSGEKIIKSQWGSQRLKKPSDGVTSFGSTNRFEKMGVQEMTESLATELPKQEQIGANMGRVVQYPYRSSSRLIHKSVSSRDDNPGASSLYLRSGPENSQDTIRVNPTLKTVQQHLTAGIAELADASRMIKPFLTKREDPKVKHESAVESGIYIE